MRQRSASGRCPAVPIPPHAAASRAPAQAACPLAHRAARWHGAPGPAAQHRVAHRSRCRARGAVRARARGPAKPDDPPPTGRRRRALRFGQRHNQPGHRPRHENRMADRGGAVLSPPAALGASLQDLCRRHPAPAPRAGAAAADRPAALQQVPQPARGPAPRCRWPCSPGGRRRGCERFRRRADSARPRRPGSHHRMPHPPQRQTFHRRPATAASHRPTSAKRRPAERPCRGPTSPVLSRQPFHPWQGAAG